MSGDPERTRGRKYHRSFSNTFDTGADSRNPPANAPNVVSNPRWLATGEPTLIYLHSSGCWRLGRWQRSLETSGFIATYPTQRPSADRPLLTGSSYSAGQALRPSTVRRSSVASQNGPEWSTDRWFCGWPRKLISSCHRSRSRNLTRPISCLRRTWGFAEGQAEERSV